MKEDFTRKELQAIAAKAKKLAETGYVDAEWKRIYERLQDAALTLDAFSAVEDEGL